MNELTRKEPLVLLVIAGLLLLLTAIRPQDYLTWFMEVAPIFIAVPLLAGTAKSFPLTPLLYRLIFLHAIILMVGGHYTYAEVPLGYWMQEWFGFHRNHYDRIGHFMQGFEPAILTREILIRKDVIHRSVAERGRWLALFVLAICLAFSACYEFIEWAAALVNGEAAQAFLGTQGDVWDTQWDMFLCLLGAMAALLLLSHRHDRELAALGKP